MQVLHKINQQLKEAIAIRDRRKLLALYEEIEGMNLSTEDERELESYDELIDQANDILYS